MSGIYVTKLFNILIGLKKYEVCKAQALNKTLPRNTHLQTELPFFNYVTRKALKHHPAFTLTSQFHFCKTTSTASLQHLLQNSVRLQNERP